VTSPSSIPNAHRNSCFAAQPLRTPLQGQCESKSGEATADTTNPIEYNKRTNVLHNPDHRDGPTHSQAPLFGLGSHAGRIHRLKPSRSIAVPSYLSRALSFAHTTTRDTLRTRALSAWEHKSATEEGCVCLGDSTNKQRRARPFIHHLSPHPFVGAEFASVSWSPSLVPDAAQKV